MPGIATNMSRSETKSYSRQSSGVPNQLPEASRCPIWNTQRAESTGRPALPQKGARHAPVVVAGLRPAARLTQASLEAHVHYLSYEIRPGGQGNMTKKICAA